MGYREVKGGRGLGPTEREPRMCPLENEIWGLDKHSGAWISNLRLGLGFWTLLEFWTLDKEFGGLVLGFWDLGQVIGGLAQTVESFGSAIWGLDK